MNGIVPFLNGARNCIKFGNVKAGEQVLILTEPGCDAIALEALSIAANEVGAKVFTLNKERLRHGEITPEVVAAAARAADIVYDFGYPTVHSRAGFIANFDYGTKFLILRPERELFSSPGAQFPVELFYQVGKKCQRIIRENPVIKITDKKGTDLSMRVVPGATGGYIGPVPCEPGPAVPGYIGTFPPGTTVWGDLNYSANGVVYLDGLHSHTRLKTPVKWTVENGFVTSIEGGVEAEELNSIIQKFRNANRWAECGFGMNPHITANLDAASAAVRVSNLAACSRRAGTFFIGVGSDALQGGKDSSPLVPIMSILYEPTVTAGDQTIIDQGKLLPLEDEDIREAAKAYGDPEELLSYSPLSG